MTDDHGLILINVREWDDEYKLPEYEDVLEFLKFVHNYVIPIYGTKNMRKWIKNNPDKTVITKVTATSIVYAVLVYESRYKVWEENLTEHWVRYESKVLKEDLSSRGVYMEFELFI